MFCHKCGSKIDERATFCPFCGTKIENDQGQCEGPPNTKAHQKPPQPPVGSAPAGSSPPTSDPNEPPSKFELWWTHAQMVEKVFFVLEIAVAVILVIVLLVNLWELLVAALVIAGVIFAFVTGSKEDRSEIRRFILKGAAVVVAIAVIAIVLVTNQDFFLNLIQPGMGVRTAYLTQYSEDVTVEEAFNQFFDNPKWSTYTENGYTYVVFAGTCEYLGERADARITFQITGEQFRVDHLDINGVEQNDLILYGLLSKIYESY